MDYKKSFKPKKKIYLNSINNFRNNEKIRKNNLILSPIPISIGKNNNKKSNHNITKDLNFNSFLSSNYSLNSTKNLSLSRDKSKDNYYDLSIANVNSLHKNRNGKDIKNEIENINKILNNKSIYLDKLKSDYNKLKIFKNNKQLELRNNLSNKEKLEEKVNNIIKDIKNNKKDYLNTYENNVIQITIEDIKYNNLNTYIKRIMEILDRLNAENFKNPIFHKYITHSISKINNEFLAYINHNININSILIVNNYFSSISSAIISYNNDNKISKNIINVLLRIILKVNIIWENSNNIINYLKSFHKSQKNDIIENINKTQNEILDLGNKKINLQKMEILAINAFSNNNSPYCDKIITKSKSKQKELLLNKKMSTIFHSCSDYLNKSKSNSIGNKNLNNNKSKKNITKYLTSCQKEKLHCKKIKIYHSKKNLRLNKIISNGISPSNSSEKKFNNNSRKNNNKNIIKSHFNKPNIKYFSKKNQLNQLIKSTDKKIDKDYQAFLTKKNINIIKDCSLFNNNSITNDNFTTKTDRNYRSILNNDGFYRNTKMIKKYNFTNLTHLLSNESSKNIIPSSINKKSNLLHIYLSKKKDQENKKHNSPSFDVETSDKPKRKISKINNQTFILNNEQFNKFSFKNIMNFDNSEKNKNSIVNQKIMESFCYYKILDKNSKLFNPLNNRISINKLGYNEGFISIDQINNCLKIKAKNSLKNNNNKYLKYLTVTDNNNNNNLNDSHSRINNKNNNNSNNFELKDLKSIYIDKIMNNIIKIHNVFLKYSKKNDKSKNNVNRKKRDNAININKILNEREIINIKDMEQNEKIKAGLCNFFSFIIELNSLKKIEFVLINFHNFKTWFNYLNNIVKMNKKNKLSNSSISCFMNNKNFCTYRIKYANNMNLKNKRKNIRRSFTDNSSHKNNSKKS